MPPGVRPWPLEAWLPTFLREPCWLERRMTVYGDIDRDMLRFEAEKPVRHAVRRVTWQSMLRGCVIVVLPSVSHGFPGPRRLPGSETGTFLVSSQPMHLRVGSVGSFRRSCIHANSVLFVFTLVHSHLPT